MNSMPARRSSTAPPTSVSPFEPVTFAVTAVLSALGALIGLVLITTLGISCNTAVMGALVAMLVGRLPLAPLAVMRDPHRQNLVQSSVSGATFAAANSLILPISVPFLMGRPDLVWPLLAGAVVGLLIDSWVLYRILRPPPCCPPRPPGHPGPRPPRPSRPATKEATKQNSSVRAPWRVWEVSCAGCR